jgi:hypothetical protein
LEASNNMESQDHGCACDVRGLRQCGSFGQWLSRDKRRNQLHQQWQQQRVP